MTKGDIYRAERDNGLTYRQIADKYGVSTQLISQYCSRYQPARFRPLSEKKCPYVNLREWINVHQVTQREMTRRLGYEALPENSSRFSGYISGKVNPPKPIIDRFIAVTGLTYEQLFETDENKKMSNFEHIKKMNIKQMSKFLAGVNGGGYLREEKILDWLEAEKER